MYKATSGDKKARLGLSVGLMPKMRRKNPPYLPDPQAVGLHESFYKKVLHFAVEADTSAIC